MNTAPRTATPPETVAVGQGLRPADPTPARPPRRPALLRRGPIGHMAVLAILWSVPVGAAIALQVPAQQAQQEVLDPAVPEVATVGSREQTLRRLVRVEVALGPQPQVAAAGGGLITAVRVGVGDELVGGTLLAEVDGIGVLANRGERPYFRDLAPGVSGADVVQLNALLEQLALPAELGSERFTAATARGVKALQKQIGAPKDGTFRPGYTWFVPADFTTVDEVRVAVGDLAASGDPVLASARPTLGATVVCQDESGGLGALEGQPVRLVIGDETLDIPALELDPSAADQVRQALAAAGRAPTGDSTEAGTLSFADLGLELRQAPTWGTVPRSALLTGSAGTVCVFTWASSTAGGGTSDAVALPEGLGTGFEISAALVPADLIGQDVVIDPTTLPLADRARCA